MKTRAEKTPALSTLSRQLEEADRKALEAKERVRRAKARVRSARKALKLARKGAKAERRQAKQAWRAWERATAEAMAQGAPPERTRKRTTEEDQSKAQRKAGKPKSGVKSRSRRAEVTVEGVARSERSKVPETLNDAGEEGGLGVVG